MRKKPNSPPKENKPPPPPGPPPPPPMQTSSRMFLSLVNLKRFKKLKEIKKKLYELSIKEPKTIKEAE